MPDAMFIEPCNFEDFPVGGQLSFARQMITAFGARLALVGISTDGTPVGRWVKRAFHGCVCDFLSIGRWRNTADKPLVPARLRAYFGLHRYRKQILSLETRAAFMSAPEALLACHSWGWRDLCFYLAGVHSPLNMSRYWWAQPFAGMFDSRFIRALRSANVLLAAADAPTIQKFAAQTGGRICPESIRSFPTRADTDIFRPADQLEARRALGIPGGVPVFVTVGRINRRKGWDLLIESFCHLLRSIPGAHLYFVGDGEDRPKVELRLCELDLVGRAHITGYLEPRQIAAYLNAANVFVLTSYFEGWPTALVEALATGKAMVSTSVSATAECIDNGKNGYIVLARDPRLFGDAMIAALSLDASSHSLSKSRPYALNRLAQDLGHVWAPLRQPGDGARSSC